MKTKRWTYTQVMTIADAIKKSNAAKNLWETTVKSK